MPDIILPNLSLELPDVGADQDTWGDILNADLMKLDAVFSLTGTPVSLSSVSVATLAATGTISAGRISTANATISGGSINNTTIGASIRAIGNFTNIDANAPASFAAGTASLPSITRNGDTNTGLFFPALDVIAVATAGGERARITAAGNLLVGTTVDDLENKQVLSLRDDLGFFVDPSAVTASIVHKRGLQTRIDFIGGSVISVKVDNIERHRTSGQGYFKASNTGIYGGVAGLADNTVGANHLFQNNTNTSTVISINESTGAGVRSFNSFLATGATGFHFAGQINGSPVYQVLANGNVQNTNNSYGAISDAKLKENVVDVPSYLDRFMQVRFRNFNFIGSDLKQFGVIAQELEQVFPGLVESTSDVNEEANDLGTVTKSVKYSILAQIQGKVIQEQQAMIQDLMQRVAALEAK